MSIPKYLASITFYTITLVLLFIIPQKVSAVGCDENQYDKNHPYTLNASQCRVNDCLQQQEVGGGRILRVTCWPVKTAQSSDQCTITPPFSTVVGQTMNVRITKDTGGQYDNLDWQLTATGDNHSPQTFTQNNQLLPLNFDLTNQLEIDDYLFTAVGSISGSDRARCSTTTKVHVVDSVTTPSACWAIDPTYNTCYNSCTKNGSAGSYEDQTKCEAAVQRKTISKSQNIDDSCSDGFTPILAGNSGAECRCVAAGGNSCTVNTDGTINDSCNHELGYNPQKKGRNGAECECIPTSSVTPDPGSCKKLPTTTTTPINSVTGGGVQCGTDTEPAISTAIGCIHTEPQAFVADLMKFVLGFAGGIAFLLMLFGAFQMITSAGNPDTLHAGRDRFTSAIIGLLIVIFAVLLMQIIGVDILQLPGFK